jgi:hypothetical protein
MWSALNEGVSMLASLSARGTSVPAGRFGARALAAALLTSLCDEVTFSADR